MQSGPPSDNSIEKLLTSQRILVLGSPGSGKTYLALNLSRQLELEPIHLDKYFWKPGWVPTPRNEWRTIVAGLVSRNRWIMDGTYESTLGMRLPMCDAILVVERGPVACTWGVIKRKLTIDDIARPDAPPGQPIDWPFLKYIWRYPFVTRPLVYGRIQELASDKPLIVLKGSGEINTLLEQVVTGHENVILAQHS